MEVLHRQEDLIEEELGCLLREVSFGGKEVKELPATDPGRPTTTTKSSQNQNEKK
jgi:hypothetical protein